MQFGLQDEEVQGVVRASPTLSGPDFFIAPLARNLLVTLSFLSCSLGKVLDLPETCKVRGEPKNWALEGGLVQPAPAALVLILTPGSRRKSPQNAYSTLSSKVLVLRLCSPVGSPLAD